MEYSEIKAIVLQYADSQDKEVLSNIDNFMRVTESRLNKKLKVSEQVLRTRTITDIDQEYYGLPKCYSGIRDIEVTDVGRTYRTTLQYATPEFMNNISGKGETIPSNDSGYYTVIAQQIQIYPPLDGMVLEIVYYEKLQALNDSFPNNWVSESYPELYIFGIMTEIQAFIKDADMALLWNDRFINEIDELQKHDTDVRWHNGSALQIKF